MVSRLRAGSGENAAHSVNFGFAAQNHEISRKIL
jgi:hypothetical protein